MKILEQYKYNVVKKLVERVKEIKNKKIKIDDKFIKEILTVNGVRFVLDDGSWGLIRASSNKGFFFCNKLFVPFCRFFDERSSRSLFYGLSSFRGFTTEEAGH